MSTSTHLTRWFGYFVTWLLLLLMWFLFVAEFSLPELFAGMAAAFVATVGTAVLQATAVIRLRPMLRFVLVAWRLPWHIVTGTGLILRGLAQQLFTRDGAPSLTRAVPFDVGGDDPRSAARRALAITYTTVTPNSIVIDIVREQGLLVFHQIIPADIYPITRQLGAEP